MDEEADHDDRGYCSVYFSIGSSRLNVPAERIMVSEVIQGTFQENVPINTVLPLTSIYLNALKGVGWRRSS